MTAYGLYNAGKIFRPPQTKPVIKNGKPVIDPVTQQPQTETVYRRLTWKRGPTEQGCRDCVTLHNVTLNTVEWQRLNDAGVFPQSHDLECNGYNCLCSLSDTEAESVGIDNVLKMLGVA